MDHPDEGWCSEGFALDEGGFECEVDHYERIERPYRKQNKPKAKVNKPTRGAKVEVKCSNCGHKFMARVADRKRGWGKFCSKSCKASKQ